MRCNLKQTGILAALITTGVQKIHIYSVWHQWDDLFVTGPPRMWLMRLDLWGTKWCPLTIAICHSICEMLVPDKYWQSSAIITITNNNYSCINAKSFQTNRPMSPTNLKPHNTPCSLTDTGFRRLENRWGGFHHTKQIREYFSCQTENAEVEISLLWHEHPEFWHCQHFQRLICFEKVCYNVV